MVGSLCEIIKFFSLSTIIWCIKQCRFGKIIWRKLPADVVGAKIGIEEFADLFFSDVQHVIV